MNLGVWSIIFEFIGASVFTITAVCMLIRLSNMDRIKANKLHKKARKSNIHKCKVA